MTSFIAISLAVVLHLMGILNAMRMWPIASIEFDEDDNEIPYITEPRTKREDWIEIYLWPIGCAIAYARLMLASSDRNRRF